MKLSNFDLKSPVLALLMCLFASLAAFSADSAAVADKAAVNEAYEYRIERRESGGCALCQTCTPFSSPAA